MTTLSLILSTASLLQVLGFGDFQYELARGVQIVEACLATQPLNGGLMKMKPLMRFVNMNCCYSLLTTLHPCFPLQATHAQIYDGRTGPNTVYCPEISLAVMRGE